MVLLFGQQSPTHATQIIQNCSHMSVVWQFDLAVSRSLSQDVSSCHTPVKLLCEPFLLCKWCTCHLMWLKYLFREANKEIKTATVHTLIITLTEEDIQYSRPHIPCACYTFLLSCGNAIVTHAYLPMSTWISYSPFPACNVTNAPAENVWRMA